MSYNRIVISSGHGKYVRGASGVLDEVDEARRVVNQLAENLTRRGIMVKTFHDDTSHSQNENLNTIVNYHNAQGRDLDISVHFNAYVETTSPMGVECLYVTQEALSTKISAAVASQGFINRGAKHRGDLFFLNNTNEPAILIETCFVDSEADAQLYGERFDRICNALALVLGGVGAGAGVPPIERPPPIQPPGVGGEMQTGKVSWFGGPEDTGVSPSEGLAFISSVGQKEELFLPSQPSGTTGLARRLNPHVHYVAMRWDYNQHSKSELLELKAFVRNPGTGFGVICMPADWGPNENTGRLADVSQSVMMDLGLETDDLVEVVFPYQT